MSQFYQQLQTLTPEQRALFEKKMAQKGLQSLPPRSIPARPSDDQPLPLSFAQQRLWFMQQLNPNNTAYNVASALKLQGALEVAALEKSLSALVARHETLRTHFELIIDAEGNSQPVQKVNLAESVQLVREDLRVGLGSDSELGTGSGSVSGSVSESNLEVIAKQRIQSITQTPFDLSKPLLRTALLQVSENSHYLVIATHHIISDRWSVMVFLREMTLLYRAFSTEPSLTVAETPAILSPLPIQYADWAIWQRQQLQGDKLKQQTDYWTRQLSGELPVLALPTDRPYRATASYQGAQVPLALSAELSEQLKGLSSQYGVTLFTLLLTAFNVLLHRYTQSDDIVVGSDIANRDRIETEGLIGLLVNTLVFRNDLSNNPRFCDCLQQVRRTVLDGLAHQDLPFEKLVEVINPERHLSQMMPLFQVKLDLQQVDVKPMQLDGLSISRHPLPETQAKYELRFNLQDTPEGIAGQVEYNCDLFDESTITRMIGHFNTLLSGIVSAPESELSALPLLSEKEHRTMLIDWNQTQKDYPNNLCIHQLFEAQAKKTPDAIALDDGHTTLTYSQLNDQANRIAHFLKDLGIGDSTGERIGETTQSIQAVGICMYRCCEMVAGLLGILKAGGTYVPLDPAYPAERLSFIVEDADIQVLLTKRENLTDENGIEETSIFSTFQSVQAVDIAEVLQHSPDDLSDLTATHITPSDLAYVIYTSGSTGKPKGVAIEHRSTVALLHWAREQFSTAELSGVLASTSICFDLSVFEIFAPLSWGGCAIVVENALALPTLPSATKVRLLNTVPSILSQLLKTSELPDSIQTVNLAGEVLPISLVKQLQQHEHITHIYNLYGPSEDTTYSTCASLHRDALTNSWDQDDLHQSDSHKESPSSAYSRVSIGKPVANTQAYVLDHFQQPVPIGVVGELYLSGDGLAQGYLHRPELTAERFVAAGSLVIASSLTTSSLTVNEASNQAASSTIKDARVYKTGDRVRYLPDGSLEFLGRFDDQVKIRGFRIETGEIEAVLNQQPSVQSAIVVAHSSKAAHSEDERLEKQLVAYIIPAVSSKHPHVSDLSEPNSEHRLSEQLRQALAKQLPDYLIPTQWVELDKLPRLPNGKINRRALPAPDRQSKAAYTAPRSELEKAITTIWRDVLGQEKVGIYDNFFELGGHSLLAIQIVTQIEMTLHQKIALQTFFQSPTVLGLAQYLEALDDKTTLPQLADEASHKRPQITPDLAQRHQPFPLTDIQQAYWLGRSQAFELGNIGTHGYRELQVSGLSVQQVEQALNRLIERHDMLRAIVNPDGQQQILPQVSRYAIAVTDLRQTDNAQTDNTQTAEAVESTLTAIRDRLSHQVFTPEQWPLFHLEAAQLPNNNVRFFISFDVLIGDAWSFQHLGKEIAQLLRGEQLTPLTLSFRDYVQAEQAFRTTPAYANALAYWKDRLKTLPPSPSLPLTMAPNQVKEPHFERRSGRLNAKRWAELKQRANQAALTPSGVVLAAFAEVLTTWSQSPHFTLNLTLFNRAPLHPEVNQIVGDFTASMLLAIDNRRPEEEGLNTFIHRARRLQNQLWEDLDHRAVSGVQVLRELTKKLAKQQAQTGQGIKPTALMPVVFTSTLNQAIPHREQQAWKSETVYSVSQTSQVYLDHQVSEIEGELVFNWDAIADLFPPNLLDEMFAAYSQLLQQLATDDTIWQRLPQLGTADYLQTFNPTEQKLPQSDLLLHELFFRQAKQQPQHLAVITPAKSLTYAELAERSSALALRLKQLSVQPGHLIAVSMEKGWQQVVAVLGTLTAGAAYVPIDPTLPQARRWQLIEETKANILLTTSEPQTGWPEELIQIYIHDQENNKEQNDLLQNKQNGDNYRLDNRSQSQTDLAYVIYTSGSTGKPKGVMIDHRGAVNTILEINQRFSVGPSDRIFALSSLSFDLSVYDIFGSLAAGATMIMPAAPQANHPTHWKQLLTEHKVTLWNSVPALMQLLLTELSALEQSSSSTSISSLRLPSLRLALLSGDWIPLSLPKQIKQHCPTANIISLGGATEASIWSIFYSINSIDSSWHSIPYGRPLSNQQWYVLDENMRPCPPWVVGELYIGGAGLAKGYWQRPALTQERFVDGLYKTGDLGRYLPDDRMPDTSMPNGGVIEFLGREDFQVKVNGYRIELGEIESALQQYPAIETAVVEAVGSPAQLVAYVVPKQTKTGQSNSQLGNPLENHEADNSNDINGAAATLRHPLEKLAFKQQQLGINQIDPQAKITALPRAKTATEAAIAAEMQQTLRRQSHRQFLSQPIELSAFSEFLTSLSARSISNAPLPKYRYASAGSLYPIQTYLHIQAERISNIAPGWYYYHPIEHCLVKLSGAETAAKENSLPQDNFSLYGQNRQLQGNSAFSLFLIANMDAIEPIYDDKSRDFCLIETGYMGQLMMEQAPDFDLGLCPIGGFNAEMLKRQLGLGNQYQPLHALVGGLIDPSWNRQWQAISMPSQPATAQAPLIQLTLQQYLNERLPSYMVPSRYQVLKSLPLTANGKVDRRALPLPKMDSESDYVAPTTPTETIIVDLWQSLLEVERVGIQDNFFEVGGNSLIAMQLLSQLQNSFQVELTIAQLFEALTPVLQAELVNRCKAKAQYSETSPSSLEESSEKLELDTKVDLIPRRAKSPPLSQINQLSDEAVDDLLAQLLQDEKPSEEKPSEENQEVTS